ncbi:hypothetical protein QOZ80_3BG0275700 [Eleusine coracana subsp. coracana]|nr:hypothetical protein QOZ80_3BG0275700 [Eleusine coracana subsp. coracana]
MLFLSWSSLISNVLQSASKISVVSIDIQCDPNNAPDLRVRFVEEVGDGYLLGLTGGSAYHFFRGLRNSPNGGRLAGAALAVRGNAPRVAGSAAAFWAVWSVFECGMIRARGKEDPWNTIAAGAAASGTVELRRGARAATRWFLGGADFFGLVEGGFIAVERFFAQLLPPEERTPTPTPTPDRDGPVVAKKAPGGHGYEPRPRGFLGIPPGPPIFVQELPADNLRYK